jgi:hypothetical protein
VRGKGDAEGEWVRGAGGGRGIRGVTPRTLGRPEESVAVGEAAGRRRLQVVGRVQGAGAGVNAGAWEALEALAAGAPPRGLDGVAGPVAGVVEHGRGPRAPGAHGGRRGGRRGRRRGDPRLVLRAGVERGGTGDGGVGRGSGCRRSTAAEAGVAAAAAARDGRGGGGRRGPVHKSLSATISSRAPVQPGRGRILAISCHSERAMIRVRAVHSGHRSRTASVQESVFRPWAVMMPGAGARP